MEDAIYNLGSSETVINENVNVKAGVARYIASICEDTVIKININFEPKTDFTFLLEVVSDGNRLLLFDDDFDSGLKEYPLNRGRTYFRISKKNGMDTYEAVIYSKKTTESSLLTPVGDDINARYLVWAPEGSSCPAENLITTSENNLSADCKRIRFEFERLVSVDYVNYLSLSDTKAMKEFVLSGSNDGERWDTLLIKRDEIVYGKVYTNQKGCYKYYDLKIGYNCEENKPSAITLWGAEVENFKNKLTCLTPYMSSNQAGEVTMTASKIVSGSASQLTDSNHNTVMKIGADTSGSMWVRYYFSEEVAANVLKLYFTKTGTDYQKQAIKFKLEGANIVGIWTLLLEKNYAADEIFVNNNTIFCDFNEKEEPYKYYRLTCLETGDGLSTWVLAGFMLYSRIKLGNSIFVRRTSHLISEDDKGYKVTASSQSSTSVRPPYYVFDGDPSTRWVADSPPSYPEWIRLQLPSAQVLTVARLTSRTDKNLTQMPSSFEIQGSSSGSTWTTLLSVTGASWSSAGETQSFSFANEEKYLYYRLYIKSNNGHSSYVSLGELDYGITRTVGERVLNKYEYVVPLLKSNSQDGYKTSASSNSTYAYRAFNRASTSDYWSSSEYSSPKTYVNEWVKVQLPAIAVCNCIAINPRKDLGDCKKSTPKEFIFEGSQDNVSWTTLLTVTDSGNYNSSHTWSFENSIAYKYYRLKIERIHEASNYATIGSLELFNKQRSDSTFEVIEGDSESGGSTTQHPATLSLKMAEDEENDVKGEKNDVNEKQY